MTKYAAKCTVYLQIESDYPDGVGEAQRLVEQIVDEIKYQRVGVIVSIARATEIDILVPSLREEPGISVDKLFLGDVCIDDGIR